MGAAVTAAMVAVSACAWCAERLILAPLGMAHWRTLVFILTAALLVWAAGRLWRRLGPASYQERGADLPLIALNCAVLAAALPREALGFARSVGCAAAAGAGFLAVLTAFASLQKRLEEAGHPRAFAGFPMELVTAALLAAAFMGFRGVRLG